MAGLTSAGLVIKRLPEVLSELKQKEVELFADLVPVGEVVDTTDSSTLGRLASLAAPSAADLWEAIQQVNAAFDPNSTTGIAQDNLYAIGGATRKEATFTTAQVLVKGDTNVFITPTSVVSSSTTGKQFNVVNGIALNASIASGIDVNVLTLANTTAYTIAYATTTTTSNITYTSDASATIVEILNGLKALVDSAHPSLKATIVGTTLQLMRVDVFQTVSFTTTTNLGIIKVSTVGDIVANEAGPIKQVVNSIDTITTPILGWDSVINPLEASTGTNRETDEEYRVRFRDSKFDRATNTLEAIYSGLLKLSTVEEVIIYENDTNVTDGNGVPAKSFLPIVIGGISADIAKSIWENKPIGISSVGNTTVSILDIQGFSHDISFQRPTPVPVYISVNLTINSSYPVDGDAKVKEALVSYFGNLKVGEDIIYSRLYTPINTVPGHQIESLFIGTSPAPVGTANIVIPFSSVATISDSNIIIT